MDKDEIKIVKQPKITKTVLNRIRSWVNQERITGEYKPFLKALRSTTVGTSHSGYNENGYFNHEMLSHNEKHLGRLLRFMPNVVGIKFQFPLLPITKTMQIAKDLNIVHPAYLDITKEGKKLHASVMTTDALIEWFDGDGEIHLMALSLKYLDTPSESVFEDDDVSKRTKEKLRLEKVYWEQLNVEWRPVTRHGPMFNGCFIKNLQEAEHRINLEYDDALKQAVLSVGTELIKSKPRIRFQSFKKEVSLKTGIKESSVHCIFWQLVWEQKLLVDLTRPVGFNEPIMEGKQWVWC